MRPTRREFLGAPLLAGAARRRPNVLVVMSDQESALLPGPANLPHHRRLQENGVTFRSAFCNTPQCSAARSALLTGLQPFRAGVVTNVDNGSEGVPLSPSLPTVGGVFQAAGYSTGYFGKWHLGSGGPRKFGFGAEGEGRDEAVAGQAAAWIRAQSGPWLAWVSFLNPHNIYSPPGGFAAQPRRPGARAPFSGAENLETKPTEQKQYLAKERAVAGFAASDWLRYRSYYCGLVEKVDACLGTVLDAVSDLDSTLAVYTSDHGDALGEHGLPFKGPFMHEELIRIPLLIAGPKELTGRGVRDDLVTQTDLFPTLAAMARVEPPRGLSGVDLTSRRNAREAVLLEYAGKQHWINPIRTIRERRWKLNWYDSGHKELYDLETDPHELRNLAGEPATRDMQALLEKKLDAWRPGLTELERRSPGRYLKPGRGEAPKRQALSGSLGFGLEV